MSALEHLSLVLLPGMDGTGSLFEPFCAASRRPTTVVRYPLDRVLTLDELVEVARASLPEGPFVLVAESFSGPVAVRLAATAKEAGPPAVPSGRPGEPRSPTQQNGLAALVLVASFVKSPLGPALSWLVRSASFAMRLPLPRFAIRRALVGTDAPLSLVDEVAAAVRTVQPRVLASRLSLLLSLDVSADAARCPVPMLSLRATRDRLVGPSAEAAVRAAHPLVVTAELDGPHLLLQRRPAEAAEAIERFLTSVLDPHPEEGPNR